MFMWKTPSFPDKTFLIVPKGLHNCQLSTVNCQFAEAAKLLFYLPAEEARSVF